MKSYKWRIALFALTGSIVAAHDLYLMPQQFRVPGGQPAIIGVHNGDEFPESGSEPPMTRLQAASLHASGATTAGTGLHADGKRAVFTVQAPKSGHFFATIVAAPNAIDMDAKEFREYLEEEHLNNILDMRAIRGDEDKPARERYTKFSKTILLAGAATGTEFSRVLDLPLEIVPEKDPFALTTGENLPVRVFLRGAPAVSLTIIAASDKPASKPQVIGTTNAQGRLAIPVSSGKWRLHTLYMEPCADPQAADWESFWATLTFQIP